VLFLFFTGGIHFHEFSGVSCEPAKFVGFLSCFFAREESQPVCLFFGVSVWGFTCFVSLMKARKKLLQKG
jgi:hypothetical protein